jgi:hypothetical protein
MKMELEGHGKVFGELKAQQMNSISPFNKEVLR